MAIRQGAVESMGVNTAFWRGKKVFLTGHTGFKGSWLSLWLQQLGAEVTGYALQPPTDPSLFEIANVAKGMKSVIGDIRDGDALGKAMRAAAPVIVIHMAAQSLVRRSYADPAETYSTNVMGTVNMLEAVRKTASVRAVINVTSDKCYDNKERMPGYREDEAMGGSDPYSSSKGCAELVTSAWRKSFFDPAKYHEHKVALASARAGNVIGGGDWAEDRLIPDILRAISAEQPVVIRNPRAIRPWQHVLEPLSGYLLLAQKLYEEGAAYAEAWNFGPNDEDAKPVQWIVERFIRQWGDGASWQLDQGSHPHEAQYLKLDCSKARNKLGWAPRWNLDECLSNIANWHQSQMRGQEMRKVCVQQIESFSKHAA